MSAARARKVMDQSALIRAAVERSGLGLERWITDVLRPACVARPPHRATVYRWISGERPMPEGVRALIEGMARRENIGKGDG